MIKPIFRLLMALSVFMCLAFFSWSAFASASSPSAKRVEAGVITAKAGEKTVNVYSYRQPFLIEPLFEKFTMRTGIDVKVLYADKGLIERIKIEGKNSPADILLTADIGLIDQAGREVARVLHSPFLIRFVPRAARSSDNRWFGLTWRARVIFVSRERVDAASMTYEELATPKWRGRLCMRDGQHPYNLALFASMLAHYGEAKTRIWLSGLRRNLIGRPSGNDRAQIRKIYAGTCDVALGNTYYMGLMQTNETFLEQKEWARSVRIIFPNAPEAGGRGTHANISGMALMRYAPHPREARKLMEFLVSHEAQAFYAAANFEYPVRTDTPTDALVKSWGDFTPDRLALEDIAAQRRAASLLVDETRLNHGP